MKIRNLFTSLFLSVAFGTVLIIGSGRDASCTELANWNTPEIESDLTAALQGWVDAFGLMGGHLLPPFASRRSRATVRVQTRSVAAPLGREELVYYYPPTSEGFMVRRDRRRFGALLSRLFATMARAWREFPDVARDYRENYDRFVSDEYWQRQFKLDAPPAETTSIAS